MTRLTKKVENQYIIECPNLQDYMEGRHQLKHIISTQNKGIHKLGQLEDIEEEYGIDLITLFKTLKQGAWFIDPRNNNKFFAMCTLCSDIDGKFECAQEEMKFHGFVVLDQLFGLGYELKDYSKTWALTKEDFE